jgi:5-methylcytosine-specific restriction endonuclease McrA
MKYQIVSKVHSGSTKLFVQNNIYFDISRANTYAASILLRQYYRENDADYLDTVARRMKIIAFSRKYLTTVQEKEGSVSCSYCNKPNLIIELEGMRVNNTQKATIDHIVPISKGGAVFDINNITPCCGTCNSKKSNKSLEEFLKYGK